MSGTGDVVIVDMGTLAASTQGSAVERDSTWYGEAVVHANSTGPGTSVIELSPDGTNWFQLQSFNAEAATPSMQNVSFVGVGLFQARITVPWRYIRARTFGGGGGTFGLVQRKDHG